MYDVDIRNPYFDVIFCTLIYNEKLFHFQNVCINNMYKRHVNQNGPMFKFDSGHVLYVLYRSNSSL